MNCQERAFILYANIVGMAHHPRVDPSAVMPPHRAAGRTLEYMDEFRRTFGKCDDPRCRHCANE